MTIERYFFYLMVYSILGWVYESIYCSIVEKKLINRGFLTGPYCPIYGWGAIIDILILGNIRNALALFILGVVLTGTLEYITSYVMEELFHARWWDYSDMKFNINGRVCLLGVVVFGFFSVFLIKFMHPTVERFTLMIPNVAFHIITAALFVIYAADNIVTITSFSGFNRIMQELSEALERSEEKLRGKLRQGARETAGEVYERFRTKLNWQQRRMIKAFPKLQSVKHERAFARLRAYMENHRKNLKKGGAK